MNIAHTEVDYDIVAKTCGCKDTTRKVTYSFVDSYHGLCKDKKDIVLSEIQACESIMNNTSDQVDKSVIETELSKLMMTLDLLP